MTLLSNLNERKKLLGSYVRRMKYVTFTKTSSKQTTTLSAIVSDAPFSNYWPHLYHHTWHFFNGVVHLNGQRPQKKIRMCRRLLLGLVLFALVPKRPTIKPLPPPPLASPATSLAADLLLLYCCCWAVSLKRLQSPPL